MRRSATGPEICLVSDGSHWGFPKGIVEPGETPEDGGAPRDLRGDRHPRDPSLAAERRSSRSEYVYRRPNGGPLVFKRVHHFLVGRRRRTRPAPGSGGDRRSRWFGFDEARRPSHLQELDRDPRRGACVCSAGGARGCTVESARHATLRHRPPGGGALRASDGRVGIYVCGITPYDSAHLGHAFVYHVFDVSAGGSATRGSRCAACATSPTSTTTSFASHACAARLSRARRGAGGAVRRTTWRRSGCSRSTWRRARPITSRRWSTGCSGSSNVVTPTPSTDGCSSTRASTPTTDASAGSTTTTMARLSRERGAEPGRSAQAPSARLRALAASRRRGSPAGRARGAPAGRAGTSSAR